MNHLPRILIAFLTAFGLTCLVGWLLGEVVRSDMEYEEYLREMES